MGEYRRSDMTMARVEGLVAKGLLCPLTARGQEWMLPRDEMAPSPLDGYVVSFARFHERGFGMPPHDFFRGLLHHYQIEVQHLNPNGIQHIAAFIALFCKKRERWKGGPPYPQVGLSNCRCETDVQANKSLRGFEVIDSIKEGS
ncbi:RIRE2 orf3 [Panicum miliaceum]|uniref:RIRE2 orf3 n=1 Tax=Panicum miliaceum TaxID=4540 RepID=A0A3L6SMH7_PANMI|nr:RIRE2 orf3 [Panicum miliaceum]